MVAYTILNAYYTIPNDVVEENIFIPETVCGNLW